MAEKFDEFSKHLAGKKSRRGAMKFLGAGIVGAVAGIFGSSPASADKGDLLRLFQRLPNFNSFVPVVNVLNPKFNDTALIIKPLQPKVNGTFPFINTTRR